MEATRLIALFTILAVALLVGFTQSSLASARAIPDEPEIRMDQLYFDDFVQGPENFYPRIEFTGDSILLFGSAGITRQLGVRVFDADGNLMPETTVTWQSSDSSVQVTSTGELTANVVSQSTWTEPVRITVQHSGLGISTEAIAAMGVLASPGASLNRAGRSSEVVLIPSNWVSGRFGDPFEEHSLKLHLNSTTELLQAGDIVVSGDYAGVMVRILQVESQTTAEVELTVEPAAINEAFESIRLSSRGEAVAVTIEASAEFSRLTVRSLRDDVELLHRSWADARLLSAIKCSGDLQLGANLNFTQPLNIEETITPYFSLVVQNFNLELWEIGAEADISISTEAEVKIRGGMNQSGECEYKRDYRLPRIPHIPIDVAPTVSAGVKLKVTAGAQGDAGWVTLSDFSGAWASDAGVRYVGGQGWDTFTGFDSEDDPTQSDQFQVNQALNLRADLEAALGFRLAFCLGYCTRFTEFANIQFLSVQGGPYWYFNMPIPTEPSRASYEGPTHEFGVGTSANLGIEANFFASRINRYIPFSLSTGISATIWDYSFPIVKTPDLEGSLDCSPSCNYLPASGGGTLDLHLNADTDSDGTASFWLRHEDSDNLTHLIDVSFSAQSAQVSHTLPSSLEAGEYEVYPRLELDSTLYWFTSTVPLGSSQPIGKFSIGEPPPTFSDCPECPTMVMIPAGTFVQGSPESEPESSHSERPQREVSVPAFAMGQTAVTFAQWDACVADGGCTYVPDDIGWGRGNRPVIRVTWYDAQQFVTWLSNKAGHDYRLPSESEWEYATRAGTTGRFNTGDCITTDQANFRGTTPAQGCPEGIFREQTLPVGSFAPNAFGLYDTHGNVWEWLQDCWNEDYVGAPSDGSAWMLGDCSRAVRRGGSWSYLGGTGLRSATRINATRGFRSFQDGGFRVARSVAP